MVAAGVASEQEGQQTHSEGALVDQLVRVVWHRTSSQLKSSGHILQSVPHYFIFSPYQPQDRQLFVTPSCLGGIDSSRCLESPPHRNQHVFVWEGMGSD